MKTNILITLLFFSLNTFATQLPPSWYDPNYQILQSEETIDEKALADIFQVQGEVLEDSLSGSQQKGLWNLSNMIVDLGVSHSGRLGLLPFEGRSAAAAFWGRSGKSKADVKQKNSDSPGVEFSFNNNMTYNEVARKAEFLTQAILGTGRIIDGKDLLKEVQLLLEDFYVVAHSLSDNPNPMWRVKRLYFDRSVTPHGKIIKGLGGSATLRFRVMWNIGQKKSIPLPPELDRKRYRIFPQLEKLVRNLADDLEIVASQLPTEEALNLKTFTVGLGFSGNFKVVGIVEARIQAMGNIEFERVAAPLRKVPKGNRNGDILFFVEKPSSAVLQQMLLENRLYSQNENGVYQLPIDRGNYRAGLQHAFKIAGHLFNVGQKVNTKSWMLNRIDVSFHVGAQGETTVSKVGGMSSSLISFAVK